MTTATVSTIDEQRRRAPDEQRLQRLRGTPRAAPHRAAAACATASGTAPTVKVFFGQGEQLVAVQRPGATVGDTLAALVAGPTAAEAKQSFRSYVPADTRVRSVTVNGNVATVDLGVGFLKGYAVDTTLARLDQVVSTVTAVPGVTSTLLLINGGTPLGLFPGVDATVPLDPGGARAAERAGHVAGGAAERPRYDGHPRPAAGARRPRLPAPVGGRRQGGPGDNRPRSSRSRSGRGCPAPARPTSAREPHFPPRSGRPSSGKVSQGVASRC